MVNDTHVINSLLKSEEPAIRYKVRVGVLDEDPRSRSIKMLRREIRRSATVQALLSQRDEQGRIATPHPYDKWQGAHWVLAALADLGYPSGDRALNPVRDQLQSCWLDEKFYQEFAATTRSAAYRKPGVVIMEGRHRRCASQQSNALWSILKLGLGNARTSAFVERLLHWQWPDGGWNCDKNPQAHHSSFMESILPLRALSLYAEQTGERSAREASERAAEIFLKRKLFLRQHDGAVIAQDFTRLHYPLYWHYDILHALKVLAESGFVTDPRCRPALELLLKKRLPDGGWPAEKKFYRRGSEISHGVDYVDWGGASRRTMNPWVTADALFVLKSADLLAG